MITLYIQCNLTSLVVVEHRQHGVLYNIRSIDPDTKYDDFCVWKDMDFPPYVFSLSRSMARTKYQSPSDKLSKIKLHFPVDFHHWNTIIDKRKKYYWEIRMIEHPVLNEKIVLRFMVIKTFSIDNALHDVIFTFPDKKRKRE